VNIFRTEDYKIVTNITAPMTARLVFAAKSREVYFINRYKTKMTAGLVEFILQKK
jgi:hypothetical protein